MITCTECRYYFESTDECRINPPTIKGFPRSPEKGGCAAGSPWGLRDFSCGDCRWFQGDYCHKRDIELNHMSDACPHFDGA